MKMPSHTSVNLKKQIKQISNVKTRGKSFTENSPDNPNMYQESLNDPSNKHKPFLVSIGIAVKFFAPK